MNLFRSTLIGVLLIFFLVACGSEPVQENGYQDFKDKIASSNFTGFAYILSDYKAEDDDYISVINDIFEKENESLQYFNVQTAKDRKSVV